MKSKIALLAAIGLSLAIGMSPVHAQNKKVKPAKSDNRKNSGSAKGTSGYVNHSSKNVNGYFNGTSKKINKGISKTFGLKKKDGSKPK